MSHISREVTVGEVHILAYCYHWGLSEILSLSVKDRRMWCEMVQKQKEAEAKAVNTSKENEGTSYSSKYQESS